MSPSNVYRNTRVICFELADRYSLTETKFDLRHNDLGTEEGVLSGKFLTRDSGPASTQSSGKIELIVVLFQLGITEPTSSPFEASKTTLYWF